MVADSASAPLPIVMAWSLRKPMGLPTCSTVAPAAVATSIVVPPAVPTVAITAVSKFAPASIRMVSPGPNPSTLATLMFARANGRRGRQRGCRRGNKIIAIAVRVAAVRIAARAGVRREPSAKMIRIAACRTGRSHVAAALPHSGSCLVAFRRPWIDEPSVVKAVDNQSGSIAQHQAAFSQRDGAPKRGRAGGELRPAEPLARRGRSLVSAVVTAASRTTALISCSIWSGASSMIPLPSACTGSLLMWANAVAGSKLIPVPRSLKGRFAA